MLYLGGLRKGSGQAPPVTARKSKTAFLLELCHTFSVPYCYSVARFLSTHLDRYRLICRYSPALLALVYSVPWFYKRKYRAECCAPSNLSKLADRITSFRAATVICVSHRAAFWVSNWKRSQPTPFSLWGINAEYGPSLGWKYL